MAEVPPELQARLRAEAARLDADAPPVRAREVRERRAPTPRSTAPIVLGAAIVILVATVVGVSVAHQDRGGRVRATNTSIAAVPAPVTTVTTAPTAQVPRQPPPGSRTVDYHGFRMFLPPSWQVVEDGCPGGPATLTLGAPPAGVTCAPPTRTGAWIWLAPALSQQVHTRSCGPGFFNGIPGCQTIGAPGAEIWFIDGLDIALLDFGGWFDASFSQIASSWQYTDATRPEAAGPGGYHQEEPLFVARDFVMAYVAGRCTEARQFLDESYMPSCPASNPDPNATFSEGRLASSSGAGPSTSATITVQPGGRKFEVKLQHSWALAEMRGRWRVAQVSEV